TLSICRRPTSSTLFPYTTLFRSGHQLDGGAERGRGEEAAGADDARAEQRDLPPAGRLCVVALPRRGRRRDEGRVALRRLQSHLRSEEHTSELQSLRHLVCRLLLE